MKRRNIYEQKKMSSEENPCWEGYEMVGFKTKNGKKVPNCVPISEENLSMKDELAAFGQDADREKVIDYEEDEPKNICKICGKKFEDSNRLADHLGEHY